MKWMWILVAALLLGGCGAEETVETVADVWAEPVMVVALRSSSLMGAEQVRPMRVLP